MNDMRTVTPAALLLGVALAFVSRTAQANEAWPPEIYNSAGIEQPLLLPLPCGGAIALQRVVTDSVDPASLTAPLADRQITMGRAVDQSRGFIEFRRDEYLTGSLSDASTGERF